MKLYTTRALASVIAVSSTVLAKGQKNDSELKPQSVCPVMGGKIQRNVFTDYKDQRIYFCCPGCEKSFNKAPEKFIKIMAERGEKPAQLQTVCPVMGGKIQKSSFADYKGKRVYFCCKGCSAAFNKDPEKYIKKLEDQGVAVDMTPEEKDK